MKAPWRCAALVGSVLLLSGCTLLPVRRAEPPDFAAPTSARAEERFPNWPIAPHRTMALLAEGVEVEGVEGAGGGTTGAEKVSLRSRDGRERADFKWKPMPRPSRLRDHWPTIPGKLDGFNNSPRKEIAAWKIQQLFLEPEEYVVPESVPYCAPVAEDQQAEDPGRATLAGTQCVLGVLSLWLQDVTLPRPLLDDARFRSDPIYAFYRANFNLLTYVIKHHDGREGNFLESKDEARPQVFAIDNGVAFGGPWYNWFVPNWSEIRVPALRKASIDRLRKVGEEQLHEFLGVLAQLELGDDGIFRNVPLGDNLDDDDGVRLEGNTLQFGLTEEEIDDVWERIEDLIEDVDEGDIAVF